MSPRRLTPILALLLLLIIATPLAQPTRAQQPDAATVIREGYDHLLNLYVEPLRPEDILTDGWNGAAGAALAAGIDTIPALPSLGGGRERAWTAFATAFADLEQRAAGRISGQQLAYAALTTMTDNRNECHTYFMTPDEYTRFRQSLTGQIQYAGIGVQSTPRPPYTVVRVYPDSPAERAGLLPGDEILAVDGVPAIENSVSALSNRIRGPEGTEVVLTIMREVEGTSRDVVIIRAVVRIPVVTSVLRSDGIGVVALNSFTENGTSQRLLREALQDLETRGASGWVLDLRGNGGGAQNALVNVLGTFLPRDTTALTLIGRSERISLRVSGRPVEVQRPLAVLIGPGSASASEITAAVLQDTGRARVFGQPSAGCVSGGLERALSDGSGMSVTSVTVLSGATDRVIGGDGVAPDEISDTGPGDPALQAAVSYLLGQVPAGRPVAASR